MSKIKFYAASLLCSTSAGALVATFSNPSATRSGAAGLVVGAALLAIREALDEIASRSTPPQSRWSRSKSGGPTF